MLCRRVLPRSPGSLLESPMPSLSIVSRGGMALDPLQRVDHHNLTPADVHPPEDKILGIRVWSGRESDLRRHRVNGQLLPLKVGDHQAVGKAEEGRLANVGVDPNRLACHEDVGPGWECRSRWVYPYRPRTGWRFPFRQEERRSPLFHRQGKSHLSHSRCSYPRTPLRKQRPETQRKWGCFRFGGLAQGDVFTASNVPRRRWEVAAPGRWRGPAAQERRRVHP